MRGAHESGDEVAPWLTYLHREAVSFNTHSQTRAQPADPTRARLPPLLEPAGAVGTAGILYALLRDGSVFQPRRAGGAPDAPAEAAALTRRAATAR